MTSFFFGNRFQDRWTRQRLPTECPDGLPDLNPLDILLWGNLKYVVYTAQPQNLAIIK